MAYGAKVTVSSLQVGPEETAYKFSDVLGFDLLLQ